MASAPYGDRPAEDWEKRRASNLVHQAVKDGVLIKPGACERCGRADRSPRMSSNIMGHHDDYSRPLEVRWLCFGCHGYVHRFEVQPVPPMAMVR